jgi:hypothetical protein
VLISICPFYSPPLEIDCNHQADEASNEAFKEMEEWAMKGYNTGDGYMGFVEGRYILFASESDYYDFMNE